MPHPPVRERDQGDRERAQKEPGVQEIVESVQQQQQQQQQKDSHRVREQETVVAQTAAAVVAQAGSKESGREAHAQRKEKPKGLEPSKRSFASATKSAPPQRQASGLMVAAAGVAGASGTTSRQVGEQRASAAAVADDVSTPGIEITGEEERGGLCQRTNGSGSRPSSIS